MSDSPPAPTLLRAGPLTLAFDRGELRWFRLGEREVLRGLYAAVRPPDWSTVPIALENLDIETGEDGFRIRFDAVHRRDPVWLEWKGALDGTPDGQVRFEMDAVARSTFLRNRVGLCVLHPMAECAGAPLEVETTDGHTVSGTFPDTVSPHQPFLGLRAIRHSVVPGLEAEVRFEGEVFEMEDQRNWSDASFKTYSTPLALPLPVKVREGERIRQVVTLSLHGEVEARPEGPLTRGWLADSPVEVEVDRGMSWPMPRVGVGLGAVESSPPDVERVRALAPAHLRVDLRPAEPSFRERLAAAAGAARACRAGLEAAVLVTAEKGADELKAVAEVAREVEAPVDAWLVFDAETLITTADLVAAAREHLLLRAQAAPLLGGGTDGFFAELNRERTAAEGLDLVSLPANPQVHAFDDATMVENTTSLGGMAKTIRSFAGDTPLALSPVSLRPRPGTDPRQKTLFAAGWTLGLVSAATAAGFGRLTLFEARGPGGLMGDEGLFPVGHLLAELAALVRSDTRARVVATRVGDGSRCLALGVQADRLLRVYAFNPTPRPQPLAVSGLPSPAWRRSFRGGPPAGSTPGGATGEKLGTGGGVYTLELEPHDIVALDAEVEA